MPLIINLRRLRLVLKQDTVLPISENSVIIPQAQLNVGWVNGRDLTNIDNNKVELGTNTSVLARVGMTYEYSNGDLGRAYISVNLFRDFSEDTEVTVFSARINNEAVNDSWSQLGTGGIMMFGDNIEAFG